MTAQIIPFPVNRRRLFLERQAQIAARMKPDASMRYIRHQIETQAVTMRRKGISEDLVKQQLAVMDAAIRMLLLPDDQTGGAN